MLKGQMEFLLAFFKRPIGVSNIFQSSPILVNRMLSFIDFTKAQHIIEFGAGAGNITERILNRMSQNCSLTCFEIEPILVNYLKCRFNNDSRLKLIRDGAENINTYLNGSKVDYIVSGLPIANISKAMVNKILGSSHYHLKEGGNFIQYQYSLFSKKAIKHFFGKIDVHFELFNIPPAFIYICRKSNSKSFEYGYTE